jgi:hypothetical protein
MNTVEILEKLKSLNTEQQVQWMIALGANLTVAARTVYPSSMWNGDTANSPGDINKLIAFNEIQHRVYGRMRAIRNGEEWTTEDFLNDFIRSASFNEIGDVFAWAVASSLQNI